MAERVHHFVCGEAASGSFPQDTTRLVPGTGPGASFTFDLHGFIPDFFKFENARLADLILVAAYILAADCAVSRGEHSAPTDSAWTRSMKLRIPVSEPKIWSDASSRLSEAVKFLSGDKRWDFEFVKATRSDHVSGQLSLGTPEHGPLLAPKIGGDVLMFSGGLDSLAGLLHLIDQGQVRPVAVTLKTAPHLDAIQDELLRRVHELRPDVQIANPRFTFERHPDSLRRESSMRTRALMYIALGVAAARAVGKDALHLFENGFVALNLPIAEYATSTKATRTVHPRALGNLRDLIRELIAPNFELRNPWILETRAQVMTRISTSGGAALIAHTTSCAHNASFHKPPFQCGECPQCHDRRLAAASSGLGEYDPVTLYRKDTRKGRLAGTPIPDLDGKEARRRGLIVSQHRTTLRHAEQQNGADLICGQGEITRIAAELARATGTDIEKATDLASDLLRRRAAEVQRALNLWYRAFESDDPATRYPDSVVHLVPHADGTERSPSVEPTFKRSGRLLDIAFDGETGTVPDDRKGYKAIAVLLARSGSHMTALAALKAAGEEKESRAEPSPSREPRLGAKGLAEAKARLAEMEALLSGQVELASVLPLLAYVPVADEDGATSQPPNDAIEAREALQEAAARLRKHLVRDTNKKGGSKRLDSEGENLRVKLWSQIDEARKLLQPQFPKLAAHLKANIKVSATKTRYEGGLTWRT